MNRRLIIFSSVLALSASPAPAQPGPSKVVVAQAVLREMETTVTLVATVEPIRRSRVAAELAGLVLDMPARQGDRIEAGGMICQLDDRTIRLRLAEEQARLDSLKTQHEELLAVPPRRLPHSSGSAAGSRIVISSSTRLVPAEWESFIALAMR